MDEATSENLQKASKALKILRVLQKESVAKLMGDFLPTISGHVPAFRVQSRFGPKQHNVHRVDAESGDSTVSATVVEYQLEGAIRFVNPDAQAGDSADLDPKDVYAEITAVFSSLYAFDSCDDDALTAFGMHNSGWHVWPYWREYVTSQCARMDLPPVTLGMYRRNKLVDEPINLDSVIGESIAAKESK